MTDAGTAARTEAPGGTLSIVMERDLPHPPEKVWRALTEPALIEAWLMKNEFAPVVGHRFALAADWGAVSCEVRTVEPKSTLVYSWNSGALRSLVAWTLTPTTGGTRLRMEQTGFRSDQPRFYGGAKAGWPNLLDGLERVLAGLRGNG
jgi:uncharacterized protein YndB with AHSA1/START domain